MEKEVSKGTSNSAGTVAVILGILGIVFALTFLTGSVPGLILSITALFFALSQRKHNPNKWSKWGLTLSIIGIVINIIVLFLFFSTIMALIEQAKELEASGILDQYAQFGELQNVPYQ